MKNYQLGKVYKITCGVTGLSYVGSTCERTLARRLAGHVGSYKCYLKGKGNYVTSFKIIENGCYEIILIEKYPCNSKDELYARERYWTGQIDCVNQRKNQGLQIELGEKEYHKHHYEAHKDRLKEYQKKYRQSNKESIKEYNKNHYQVKKDTMNEYSKQFYQVNKVSILKYQNQKHKCECGKYFTTSNKSNHLKSQFHQDYKEKQSIPDNAIPIQEGSNVYIWDSI